MTTRPREQAQPLLIVGSMAFDDLDLPSTQARDVVGGSATYAALASNLFAPARIVAVVGEDFPEEVLSKLSERGIDVSGIERASGKTFRWWGRYADNLASRTTLDTQLNVFADFRPALPPAFCDSPFVMLGNIHPALQLEVLAQVRSPRFVVADTMNFWIEGERKLLGEVLAKLDLLVINDEELRQLSGIHNIRRAARAVLALGPKSSSSNAVNTARCCSTRAAAFSRPLIRWRKKSIRPALAIRSQVRCSGILQTLAAPTRPA
jgi:sugar/nucleoside kinase (ribokinase family)